MQRDKLRYGEMAARGGKAALTREGRDGYFADRDQDRKGAGATRPGSRFDSQTRLLLLVNALFGAANALSGTFVNVYLWKAKSDFALIGWFAFAHQVTMALTFWAAGKWVKEHNKMNSLRLGVAISAVFYTIVLVLQQQAVHYVWLLGAVQGLSSGFFWLAFNVVYFEVTSPENRDRFNGWAGLLGSGIGMIAPWISGWLITGMPGTNGYRLIFAISLGVFVVGVVFSFFLKKRKVPGTYEWAHGYRTLAQRRGPWKTVFGALVAQGIREGVFGFLIGLMVYIATSNEMKIGNFSLITSAVALFSFYAVGKWLKPAYRKGGMIVGVLAMILVIVPFFWQVSYATLLVFGIGTALFIPLYTVPMTSSVFDIIGQDRESAEHRVEYVVLRELGLNFGRMLGTLAFIAVVSWSTAPHVINWLLLGIGSSPLLVWLLMRNKLVPVQFGKSR
ncbi:MFS transporter [Paenibacillus flagellatus]|uniref:MFS transporter n=1 Tax=Paenibacillus flagellatus TaxID=2211139 RepID=A0A2V5KPL7_9BACL|nr:MFS transporter [Paenibacillus flagellatus]PYI53167.1 MFS transporter [Paenibacillus flagellatus]